MAKNKNRGQGLGNKKTEASASSYKSFIEKSPYCPADTVENINEMLTSSEFVIHKQDNKLGSNYIKKSIKNTILDLVKNNFLQTILSAILVAIIIFIVNFIYSTNLEIALISQKLLTIEQSVNSIVDKNINKEDILMQLDNMKRDIENGYKLDIIEIQLKLEYIEKELNKSRLN